MNRWKISVLFAFLLFSLASTSSAVITTTITTPGKQATTKTPRKRHPKPCYKRSRRILKILKKKKYVDLVQPRCDHNGLFKPVQCNPVAGCYCVDRYGKRLDMRRRKKQNITANFCLAQKQ